MERKELIKSIPLFDGLNAQELEEIGDLFQEISRLKGETICREGEEGDSLYVLLSGELEVWSERREKKRIINRLLPGDFFGEITLLTGEMRSATVTVARDARLLVIDRKTFESFFRKNAKMLEHLSKVMAQRLAMASRGEITPRATTVISVVGAPGIKGKSLTASSLAGLLEDFTGKRAIHVGFHLLPVRRRSTEGVPLLTSVPGKTEGEVRRHIKEAHKCPAFLEIGVNDGTALNKIRASIGGLLEVLNDVFSYVVFDADGEAKRLIASITASSDYVIRIEGRGTLESEDQTDGPARVFSLVNRFNRDSGTIPINHMEPFVLPADLTLEGRELADQARYIRCNPRASIARPLHRLARKILGTTVGIALGGGAAFGIAHIGVLKALEENAVPVDLVSGTSMGSIIALGYAAGLSGSDMVDIARRAGTRWKTISALDITLTKPGFLKGNRLMQIFSPMLEGRETFEDLFLPCRTVAADIESGECVTIHSGRLDMAFRASCSVPLVMSPVFYQGRSLVDGAIVDPVPAEVVKEMGADICLAVNVVPPLQKGVETFVSRLYRQANRLNPLSYLSRETHLPNLFDIIMNSIQTLQYELGNFKAISADVRINPDLSGHTWIEFYKPMAFIEEGIRATERALPEIRRVIEERSSAHA